MKLTILGALPVLALGIGALNALPALAQSDSSDSPASSKPNILLIVSDDTGYGDTGPYLGGETRGMPTPNIDQLANDGMMFTSFYAQPSCTPGRAAMQTGRIPNRSGMTTVAFQGQGGGLPAAEWTLASVLKEAGYNVTTAEIILSVLEHRPGRLAAISDCLATEGINIDYTYGSSLEEMDRALFVFHVSDTKAGMKALKAMKD